MAEVCGGNDGDDGCSVEVESPAKVRIMQIPKYEKLNPELTGFGVSLQAMAGRVEEINGGVSNRCDEKMERGSEDVATCFYDEEIALKGIGKLFGGEEKVDGVHLPTVSVGCSGPAEHNVINSDCYLSVEEMGKNVHDKVRGKRLQVENGGGMQQVHQNGASNNGNLKSHPMIDSIPRPSPDEGSSNFASRRTQGHTDVSKTPYGKPALPSSVQNLEQDRAELLRKLDELKHQLSQSCKVVSASNEGVPASNGSRNLYPNAFPGENGWFRGRAPPFNHHTKTHSAFMDEHESHFQKYRSALHAQNEMFGCTMPFRSRTNACGTYKPHSFFPQRESPHLAHHQFDMDSFIPYQLSMRYPHSSCSCLHLCNQQWQAPSHAASSSLVNRRDAYHANGHGFYPGNGSLDSGFLTPGISNSSIISGNPPDSQRLPFKNYNVRNCQPFAGGAPFVACCNCSELLEVPQTRFLVGKYRYKLCCGSCSQVISIELDKHGLIVSTPHPAVGMNLQPNMVNENRRNPFSYEPYDGDFVVNPRSSDERAVLPPCPLNKTLKNEACMNLADAENMEGMSSSSSESKDDRIPDEMVHQRDASRLRELQRPEINSCVPGLPFREHFGHSASSIMANQSGTGNRSMRSDEAMVVCVNRSFTQNPVKSSVATEMDLMVDEYPNPTLSGDSDEAGKEDDLIRISKGGESFFTGIIKKSFKHLENRKLKVSVNGHSLPDRAVKKAEKLAGPIQPGDYWYDCRAGFWGLMGQHCLGIIPPFIEELSYPMPKHCAGGDTGVFVNGRELHRKDLELLAGRGLPTSRDRSYIIDISGKVSDADSGEFLEGLGKLAPTVEKMKHGFGMRVPKETLDSTVVKIETMPMKMFCSTTKLAMQGLSQMLEEK